MHRVNIDSSLKRSRDNPECGQPRILGKIIGKIIEDIIGDIMGSIIGNVNVGTQQEDGETTGRQPSQNGQCHFFSRFWRYAILLGFNISVVREIQNEVS